MHCLSCLIFYTFVYSILRHLYLMAISFHSGHDWFYVLLVHQVNHQYHNPMIFFKHVNVFYSFVYVFMALDLVQLHQIDIHYLHHHFIHFKVTAILLYTLNVRQLFPKLLQSYQLNFSVWLSIHFLPFRSCEGVDYLSSS